MTRGAIHELKQDMSNSLAPRSKMDNINMASEIQDSSLETDGAPISGHYSDILKFHANVLANNEIESSNKRKREVFAENSNSSESSFELGACSDTGERLNSGGSSSSSSDGSAGLESTLSDLDLSDGENKSPRGHASANKVALETENDRNNLEWSSDGQELERSDLTKSKVEEKYVDDDAILIECAEECVTTQAHDEADLTRDTEHVLDPLDPLSGDPESLYQKDKDGDNLLHIAIVCEQIEPANALIGIFEQHHLNDRNNLFQTPLHLAVLTQQGGVARALLAAGACPHLQDARGRTPVHIECENKDASMLRILLEAESSCLILNERLETIHTTKYCSLLADQSSSMSTTFGIADYEGQCPIHVATSNGDLDLVKMLVSHGDDVNRPERKSGRTALHMATEMGHQDIAEYLLDQENIQFDQKTRGDETAIAIAFHRREGRHGNAIYELLKDKGAKVDLKYFAKFGIAAAEINKRFRSVSMENGT